MFYRRYVDDSFVIFENQVDVQPFFNYINNIHPNIVFTKEEQVNDLSYFPFLDVKVTKIGKTFLTSTYYKPTHTGLYTNWYSFTPRLYKINLVKCLIYRAWNVCSNRSLFNNDWKTIKENLLKNQYPEKLLDSILANFIENNSSEKDQPVIVPKKEVLLVLPYYGHISSLKLKKNLLNLIKN